jgi:adenylate kinase family enzyme
MASERISYLYSVGIDDYANFPTLSFCAADATEMGAQFGERLKTNRRIVRTSDSADMKRTSSEELGALLKTIKETKLSKLDSIIFYFAGHGFSFEGRDFLVCSDTEFHKTETAIATDELIAALVASGAGTSILIVDACRNKLDRDIGTFGQATAELAKRTGVIVFCGCSPGQTCKELAKLGHGIFTYCFLKATAEQNPATPLAMDQYVIPMVEKICSDNKLGPQTPYTSLMPLQKASVDIFTGEFVKISTRHDRRCLLIVGPSNAGKTSIGQLLASKLGMIHVEMSSFAYQRYQASKLKGFQGSIQDFMEQVVWSHGKKDVIADDVISADPGTDRIVICGPRTVEEVDRLRKHDWSCRTFFLYANSQMRYHRYETTQSDRYSLGYPEFVRKDLREYSWGLAKAATMRDVDILVNEDQLSTIMDHITREIQS